MVFDAYIGTLMSVVVLNWKVAMCLIKHQLINVLFSALTLQFVKHRFLDYHDPTIGKSKDKL
jgi:hypothetical protein